MEAAGEVVVPLEPSVDGLEHVGLPLDTAVEKMITHGSENYAHTGLTRKPTSLICRHRKNS